MTDTSEDPVPISQSLQEQVARAQQVAMLHRAVPAALEPDEGDEYGMAADRAELTARRWRAVVPARFHQAQLVDLPADLRDGRVGQWATEPNPAGNLVLLGDVGTGRSHAAVGAVRPAFERGLEVRFLPVVELLDLLRPGGPEGVLYDLADVDRLVLDDIGMERATDWTMERMYALVNRRWLEGRPTIATSNLPGSRRTAPAGYDGVTLDGALGERTFSRLVGSSSVVVKLTGPDRRRNP